jgi:protein-tyrosine phosphatase
VIYTVDLPGPGRLSTMAKPRLGDLPTLRAAGVDILVCALTDEDFADAGLTDEPKAAVAAGLEFVHLPIPDWTVPDRDQILPVLRDLAARLDAGAGIVTHCWAGIGRSSLLAASIMVLRGLEPDDAWARITKARGYPVPDTEQQREWVRTLTS